MKRIHAWQALAMGLWLSAGALQAKEPVMDFLEGLRQRQYYDMAEEYLESLRTKSSVSEEIRQIIPYEQGRTLVDSSRNIRDMPLRLKELDRAAAQVPGVHQGVAQSSAGSRREHATGQRALRTRPCRRRVGQ